MHKIESHFYINIELNCHMFTLATISDISNDNVDKTFFLQKHLVK